MSEYTIYGGDKGYDRLVLLSRILEGPTASFLRSVRIAPGSKCLDLGCGSGDVTMQLSALTGPEGTVLGTDIDVRKIELARGRDTPYQNVSFKVMDAYALGDEQAFSVVYMRFLVSHMSAPREILDRVFKALVPGGKLAIEDTDFSGHFSHPQHPAFQSYVHLYQQLLRKRGANADRGQELPALLRDAGFTDITVHIEQPVHLSGEGKRIAEITFEGVTEPLIAEGLVTRAEAERIQRDLILFRERDDSLMSMPRIVQVAAVRP